MADWDAIRKDYITGNSGLKDLAAKYGLTKRALEKHSSAEEWPRLRSEYQRTMVEMTEDVTREVVLNAAATYAESKMATQEKVRQTAEALADLIRSTMAMADGAMLPRDIKSLTGALKDINEITTSGNPEGAQGIEMRIAGLEESWLQ